MYEGKAVEGLKQGISDVVFGQCEGQPDAKRDHRHKVLRYGVAHRRAEAMALHLRLVAGQSVDPASRLVQRAAKLEGCGAWLTFRDYFTAGEVRLTSATFCQQDKLCPLCAIRRGGRFLRAYSDRIKALRLNRPGLRFWLLSMTVLNGSDLAERFGHLVGAWERLLERRRNALKGQRWCELVSVLGGVSSIEIKRGKGSGLWHPHLHAVVASECDLGDPETEDEEGGRRWAALSAEWWDLTGDSKVVDVRAIKNPDEPGRDLTEVFKYALKFADLDLPDNLHAFEVLFGRRLVRSFGNFWGVQVPESLLDEPLAPDLPFIEILYRYAGEGLYRQLRERVVPAAVLDS
jgi:hypothetical protein